VGKKKTMFENRYFHKFINFNLEYALPASNSPTDNGTKLTVVGSLVFVRCSVMLDRLQAVQHNQD
jgi:hypothetical protein